METYTIPQNVYVYFIHSIPTILKKWLQWAFLQIALHEWFSWGGKGCWVRTSKEIIWTDQELVGLHGRVNQCLFSKYWISQTSIEKLQAQRNLLSILFYFICLSSSLELYGIDSRGGFVLFNDNSALCQLEHLLITSEGPHFYIPTTR